MLFNKWKTIWSYVPHDKAFICAFIFIPSTADSTGPSFQNEQLVYENEFPVFFLLKSCASIHIIASVLTVKEGWKTKSNGVLKWRQA